jgi:hypothetical protein
MPRTAPLESLSCSFCGKTQVDVAKLVAGPGVYICNVCVDLCTQIIADELRPKRSATGQEGTRADPPDPPDIRAWEALSDDALLRRWSRPTPPMPTSTVRSASTSRPCGTGA